MCMKRSKWRKMWRRHKVQPFGSALCGQCCIAILAKIPLSLAIELVGHEGKTTTREIHDALVLLGFDCSSRLSKYSVNPPENVIVKCARNPRQNNWHWACKLDGEYFDPLEDVPGELHWPARTYLAIHRMVGQGLPLLK